MRTHFDCFNCFLTQAKRVGQLLGLKEENIWSLLKKTAKLLSEMEVENSPPRNAVKIYREIAEEAGSRDPFSSLKKQSIDQALELLPILEKKVAESQDPLEAAIKYSAAGNVIDYGISSEYDLLKEIDGVIHEKFYLWEYDEFKRQLDSAQWVLILGDNCGESVLDRLLITKLNKPVYYAVRGGPIINDVTMKDAIESGLDEVATLISTGCAAPGIVFEYCSKEFIEIFNDAPIIISKGQGNFETLSGCEREIFYLFKIKCNVVASFIGCQLGSMFFSRFFKKDI